ncbi:MAG: hypothetical protein GXO14_06050 [Thermococci archaeon]|nr:hypothetical protein [Thermococci archaeon]
MKAKIRRGQIFSADALIALALVVMITSIVVNTSGDVQGEISNLLGWYERANVAQNMLGVLVNSPGEPANWSENVSNSTVYAIGLRSTYGSFVSYEKILAFIRLVKSNDSTVKDFLSNLSLDHPFLLELYLGRWSFTVNFSWISNGSTPGTYLLNVSYLSARYTYPSNITPKSVWRSVAYVNGTLTADGNLTAIEREIDRARWVEYAGRMVSVNVKEYPLNLSITGNSSMSRMILGGVLGYSLPSYATFTVEVPNETGYAVFTAVDGNVSKVLTVWKNYGKDVRATVWEEENGRAVPIVTYLGNQTAVKVPWRALFGSGVGSPVSMWIYANGFSGTVSVIDNGNIGTLLLPLYDPMMIRLWVWEP